SYDAFVRGEDPALPERAWGLTDQVSWQRNWLQGENLAGRQVYWQRQLAGAAQTLDLPFAHPRPPLQTFDGETWTELLPDTLVSPLRTPCRRQRATLFMGLFAAFNMLLSRYTGQEDIVIGCPFANRPNVEAESLIGYFANALPLRTDLSGDPSFLALL